MTIGLTGTTGQSCHDSTGAGTEHTGCYHPGGWRPRYAMMTMAVGALLNIILDPVAIFVGMGNPRAAYATIFGQFVSFLLCAGYLIRSKTFRLHVRDFRPDGRVLLKVVPLGGSSFMTQISIVVVTIVNNKQLVSYGAVGIYGGISLWRHLS